MSYMTVGVSVPASSWHYTPHVTEIAFIFIAVLHRCYNVIACMVVPSVGTRMQMLESGR